MFLLSRWEYILALLGNIIAAVLLHRRLNKTNGKLADAERNRAIRMANVEKFITTQDLREKFFQAGNPLKLTAVRFQIIRYMLALFWLANSSYDVYSKLESVSLVEILYKIGSPFLFLIITNTIASPVTFTLSKMKEINDGEKNREFFMIYNMVADELNEDPERRLSLQALLTKLKDYTQLIKPSINKGLREFEEGIDHALNIIAEDIGTKEAKEICNFMADLETIDPAELSSLVHSREESYYNMLRENRRRRRKFFGHIAYAIVFSPILLYIWNLLTVSNNYMTFMSNNQNFN